MKLDLVVEQSGVVAARPNDIKEAVKSELYLAGEYWHKNFRKRHFHASAFQFYRYTPRSKKYQWRKLRRGLGNNPLVFTGVSKRLSEGKTIRATHEKVDVVMSTRAFNFRAKNSQVNMRDEFTQINEAEHAEIDRRTESGLVKRLQSIPVKKTRVRDSSGRFASS